MPPPDPPEPELLDVVPPAPVLLVEPPAPVLLVVVPPAPVLLVVVPPAPVLLVVVLPAPVLLTLEPDVPELLEVALVLPLDPAGVPVESDVPVSEEPVQLKHAALPPRTSKRIVLALKEDFFTMVQHNTVSSRLEARARCCVTAYDA